MPAVRMGPGFRKVRRGTGGGEKEGCCMMGVAHYEQRPSGSQCRTEGKIAVGSKELSASARRERSWKADRIGRNGRCLDMPAKSKKQQMAAGAALAAKRGEKSKTSL